MADFDIVVEKLHSFETANDLADYFREYGIKAKPQEARSCAISVFVEMETGEKGRIMTSTRDITLRSTVVELDGYEYEVAEQEIVHTHAMRDFVRSFDSGRYPFLIEDGYDYDESYGYEADCDGECCGGMY